MAINWIGNRYREQYEYVKVSWQNWNEIGVYDYITGGSVELSASSELKATGDFTFQGTALPDVNNLLRVYYSFYDDQNNYERKPIATFFISYGDVNMLSTSAGIVSSGNITASSMLVLLQKPLTGRPYTIKKNSNAIYIAQKIVRDHGLNVDFTPDSTIVSADHTFTAGTSYLEIVNWLCKVADYRQAHTDEYGTVLLKPKREILQNDSVWTFKNNNDSIMYPEVQETNNWQETPNVVRLLYATDNACAIAEAKNITGSKTSLEANGNREITTFEEIGEVGKGKILTKLINMAEKKLLDVSCDTEYVTFSHAWIPINVFDIVTINYATKSWFGNVDTMSIQLSPSTKTQTKIRRDLYDNIVVSKTGEVIWNRDSTL